MNHALSLSAAACLCGLATAQVTELQTMTIPSVAVSFSDLPLGATSLTAIRNIGNGGDALAQIAAITLVDNGAPTGFYNVNVGPDPVAPSNGRTGLARSTTGSGLVVVARFATYNAFDATIDFEVRGREFGVGIGDYRSGLLIEFRNRSDNSLVDTYETTDYGESAAALLPKFLRASADFDRVVIRPDLVSGNYVLTQVVVPATPAWIAVGQGCQGTGGIPELSALAPPSIGATFSLSLSNLDTNPGAYIMVRGLSTTSDPFLGALPFSLAVLGAPGCNVLVSIADFQFLTHNGGSTQYDLPIPNNIALIGAPLMHQAFVADTFNALGLVASNGGAGSIQP